MEAKIQKEINNVDSYTEEKQCLLRHDFLRKTDNPKIWQNSWFALNEPCDEQMRMIVVVALLVYELEQNNITSEMIGELDYYYYEAFEQKSFDDVFEEPEAKEKCFADLKWCYETAKEKGLLED